MVGRPFSYGTFLATLALVRTVLAIRLICLVHAVLDVHQQLSQLSPVYAPPLARGVSQMDVVSCSKAPPGLSCDVSPVQDHVSGVPQVSPAGSHLVGFVQVVHAEPVGLPWQLLLVSLLLMLH